MHNIWKNRDKLIRSDTTYTVYIYIYCTIFFIPSLNLVGKVDV